ncbi:BnaA07g10160D [Brassica napus]|uniref:BnaA07g10160D protein n=2 Tax=Brassica TaxID=3705 RepID=A0A078GK52_BRANA|nr:BnaA07g10160D [Brassica napus]VDC97717.1 unnamed protein product [Brassica rapa]
MAGEIQEPLNLSLLENSIHSGSVSFGRFEKESLSWEKRSSFSHNRYLEEAERFSKPGSVTQMRAHFEAHFKKKGIKLPSSVEAQTWGEVAQHHQQTASEKEENLWEKKSSFGDSCLSYESYDDHSSLSVASEKIGIGCSERSVEDKAEMSFPSATALKSLKNDRKATPSYAKTTKTTTKKDVVIAKGSSSCNTKTSFDTKRGKEMKPALIVKSNASQAPVTKKTESLTPLAANKFRSKNTFGSAMKERTATNGFSSRSSERVEKRKEENVEAIVQKSLNFKARPVLLARPQDTSIGQEKVRKDAQAHSSKASSNRSLANGAAKSKLNINKQKVDTQRSLTGIRPNSRDQTAKNNANGRSLAVRRAAVEVAL